jgi:hypothetical protein
MLDEEKPDLVILSGDQVNGDTAPDAPSVCYPFALSESSNSSGDMELTLNRRLYINTLLSLSSAKYHTPVSSATTMTKSPCRERPRWR